MFISIGKVSKFLGVSISSLRRWDQAGLLCPAFRTPGGHRRYKYSEIMEMSGQVTELQQNLVLGYARVSGHKQKTDLHNQIKTIENYASKHNLHLEKVYKDIASGLNDTRVNFMRLLRDVPSKRPKAVIITYKDRLSRFGCNVIKLFFNCFSCKIIYIKETKEKGLEEELVDGVIAVITSYAGCFHRKRRGNLN
jgi:predicted site-specific integrase-resolvase